MQNDKKVLDEKFNKTEIKTPLIQKNSTDLKKYFLILKKDKKWYYFELKGKKSEHKVNFIDEQFIIDNKIPFFYKTGNQNKKFCKLYIYYNGTGMIFSPFYIVRDLEKFKGVPLLIGKYLENKVRKKKDKKDVFIVNNFLPEELEFFKEEGLDIPPLNNRWKPFYENPQLFSKYFLSILAPYFIVKPNLEYLEIHRLGFNTFRSALSRCKKLQYKELLQKYKNVNAKSLEKYFGKEIIQEKLENARLRIISLGENFIPDYVVKRYKNKLKLLIDLGYSNLECEECGKGSLYFPSFQLHHLDKQKNYSIVDIHNNDYKTVLESLKNEKIKLLCSNCHKSKLANYPILFKEIVFHKELFQLSAEEINRLFNKKIKLIKNSKKYQKIDISKQPNHKIKYNIKKWIRKRFVFEHLFNCECLGCGNTNIFQLDIHHTEKKIENKSYWNDICSLSCKEIINILKEEKCVCLCSNCHYFIHSYFYKICDQIFKDFLDSTTIKKIKKLSLLKYKKIIQKSKSFAYSHINKFPLELVFNRKNSWKTHLLEIYFYLKKEDKNYFTLYNFYNHLGYSQATAYTFVEKLIENNCLTKIFMKNNIHHFYISKNGLDVIEDLIKESPKKIKNIEEKIISIKKKENIEKKDKIYSHKDILIKYSKFIFEIINERGLNEFCSEDLIPKVNKERTTISSHLRTKLLPNKLIKEVINPSLVSLNYKFNNNYKIYSLTDKGIRLAKNKNYYYRIRDRVTV